MTARLLPVALLTGLVAGLLTLVLLVIAVRLSGRLDPTSFSCAQVPTVAAATVGT